MYDLVTPQNIDLYFSFKHVPGCGRQFRPFNPLPTILSFDSATVELRNLLQKSAVATLANHDENGVYHVLLSGGLDSCITLHLLREHTNNLIRTYTLHYADAWEGKQTDLEYARRLSDIYQTEHYEKIVTAREMWNDLPKIVEELRLPFAGFVSPWFASKMLPDAPVYTGDLSDELFGSYKGPREASLESMDRENLLSWRRALPAWIVFTEYDKERLYSNEFKKQCNLNETKRLFDTWLPKDCSDTVNAMIQLDWVSIGPDQVFYSPSKLMRQWVVSPYMNRDVIDFVNSLPGEYKVQNGNVKRILKEAFRGVIPDWVIERPKEGFVQPSNHWLKHQWEKQAREVCGRPSWVLKPETVRDIVDKYYAGDDRLQYQVWTILCFQLWSDRVGAEYGY